MSGTDEQWFFNGKLYKRERHTTLRILHDDHWPRVTEKENPEQEDDGVERVAFVPWGGLVQVSTHVQAVKYWRGRRK